MSSFLRLFILQSVCFFAVVSLHAQMYFTESPKESWRAKVYDNHRKELLYPWAGGMFACQFCSIDIDLDGKHDLLVFDRIGNRKMTFLNKGVKNESKYEYAPMYASMFPDLTSWVITADYNQDGKQDLFTYSAGYAGIKVYKNTSGKELKFDLEVFPYLKSFQGGGYVNILVTDVDYPGIADIDGDGDLDILTFWGLGSFVEMHKNMSVEKYGIPDSLDFVKTTNCWGYFAESEESNELFLDTCLNWPLQRRFSDREGAPLNDHLRHTGSTFTLLDMNNDGVMDLILGDVDFPGMALLMNGGTPDSAYMISQDLSFPSGNIPVSLFSFPLASYVDINNDGVNDLIVAPFDPGLYHAKTHLNNWLYLNYGTNTQPDFRYMANDFIQEGMLDFGSGAYPVLADFDSNGLPDLVVANYGYYDTSYYLPGLLLKSEYSSAIALFRNSGTAEMPEFSLVTSDLANLRKNGWTAIYPTFADLDLDGDLDIILGTENGDLYYLENISGPGLNPQYSDPVNLSLTGIGQFTTPQLFDLDEDGLPDLIVGEKGGNLNYFRNTGSPGAPIFTFVTDSLGKVNVTDPWLSNFGYSVPCFFINTEGKTGLLVGSEQGKIFYFTDIEGNLEGSFTESPLLHLQTGVTTPVAPGRRSGCAIADLNGNGYLDLIAGNFSGGLNYYSGAGNPNVFGVEDNVFTTPSLHLFPNPASKEVMVEITHADKRSGILLDLMDMTGAKVMQGIPFSGKRQVLSVAGISPGVYIVRASFPQASQQVPVSVRLIVW